MSSPQKLAHWLRSRVYNAAAAKPPVCLVRLEHRSASLRSSVVEEWPIANDRAQDWEEIGELVFEAAETDTEGQGGRQRYLVSVYRDAERRPDGRFPFMVTADPEINDGEGAGSSLDSEPATLSGIVSQQMRHNEGLLKMLVSTLADSMKHMRNSLGELVQENREMRDKHLETMRLMEEMISMREHRQLEVQRASRDDNRKDQLIGKITTLLPVVAGKIAAHMDPSPASVERAGLAQIRSLVESLTPEQIDQLGKVLRPEQAIAMLELSNLIDKTEGDGKKDDPK